MEMANGETPLMAAAVNGDVDQVRALLAAVGEEGRAERECRGLPAQLHLRRGGDEAAA